MRKLTLEDVEVVLIPHPEEESPEDLIHVSTQADRNFIARIRRKAQWNPWAWACIETRVRLKEFPELHASSYLGGCNYNSEKEFRTASGYFNDLVKEALAELQQKLNCLEKILDLNGEKP